MIDIVPFVWYHVAMNVERIARTVTASYNDGMKKIHCAVKNGATPGKIRGMKGMFGEHLANVTVREVWKSMGGNASRLTIDRKKICTTSKRGGKVNAAADAHVSIDHTVRLVIECKSFTDMNSLKSVFGNTKIIKYALEQLQQPNPKYCLFQLESMCCKNEQDAEKQLTFLGDIFDVEMDVFTLLDGRREMYKPIHCCDTRKPLSQKSLTAFIEYLQGIMEPHV